MEFRTLNASEIECRVATVSQKGCSLLLYKDARADMNLLDEVVGAENWQRKHELINGNLFCNVGIKCGSEWVWKQDVGTESYTEKEKGQASDSFKRACFNWGIGRELYTAPFIWISDCDITPKGSGYTTYDKFEVKSISYDDSKNIIGLEIVNTKTKRTCFSLGKKSRVEKITKAEAAALNNLCIARNVNVEALLNQKKIKSFEELNADEYVKLMEKLKC